MSESLPIETATCRFCGTVTRLGDESGNPDDTWFELADLVQTWYETGQFSRRCDGCGLERARAAGRLHRGVGRRSGHRTVYTGARL